MAAHDLDARLPPRKTHALPDFRQIPAACRLLDGTLRFLEAQHSRIHGNVRTSLVDHSHHAHGDGDACKIKPVVQPAMIEDAAKWIGKGRQILKGGGHIEHALVVQHQAIEKAFFGSLLAGSDHIVVIGFKDNVDLVAQSTGHGEKDIVALGVGEQRNIDACPLRSNSGASCSLSRGLSRIVCRGVS